MTGHTPQHERYPAPHPDLIRRLRKHAEELAREAQESPDTATQVRSAFRSAGLTHAADWLEHYANANYAAAMMEGA